MNAPYSKDAATFPFHRQHQENPSQPPKQKPKIPNPSKPGPQMIVDDDISDRFKS